jgi:ribulose-phosphate 3-epimerase
MSALHRRGPLIAPSILAADFSRLGEEVRAIESAGADLVHVDVMDGHFVPNISIGPAVVKSVRSATSLPLDVHLMIEKPERYIQQFINAGAATVGIHVETCPDLHHTLAQIRNARARTCVVLNPATPAEAIQAVLPEVDQVLVMTVNPGFGGQSFIADMLSKIEKIQSWIDEAELSVDLEVDGGIARDTIAAAATAGANVFVAGTAVFAAQSYAAAIRELRDRASVDR